MRWKAILTVFIILLLLGTIFLTDAGRKYAGYFSSLIGSFTTLIKTPTSEGRTFTFTLTTDKSVFQGQTYNLQNSTFISLGNYLYIKIDDGIEKIKDSSSVDMWIGSANGKFELTKEGTTRLAVNSNHIIINTVERTRDKAYALEAEIQPVDFVLSPVFLDKISFASINGNLRIGTKTTVSADLSESSMDIYNFAGYLQLSDNKITLSGFASKIVVNGEEVGISAE